MSSCPVRVLIVDSMPVVRIGLTVALRDSGDIEVAGEASNGEEAIARGQEIAPDVIILDTMLLESDCIELITELRQACPQSGILLLATRPPSPQLAVDVARAGACGLVSKGAARARIVDAVRGIRAGRACFDEHASQHIVAAFIRESASAERKGVRAERKGVRADGPPPCTLTPRERQVLFLVAEGNTSKEIAAELGISPRTVEAHRARLCRKLEVHSAAGLIRYAYHNDVTLDEAD